MTAGDGIRHMYRESTCIKGDPDCIAVICVPHSNLTEHTFSFRAYRSKRATDITRVSDKTMSGWSFSTNAILVLDKSAAIIISNLFLPSCPEAGSGMSQESIYRYKDLYWLNSFRRYGYMVVGQMC